MLNSEKNLYRNLFSRRDFIIAILTGNHQIKIYKYIKLLRLEERFFNNYKNKSSHLKFFWIILTIFTRKRKNGLGNKISIDIRENSCGNNLLIYHQNVLINGHSRLGDNCILHGNNCIGNNGSSPQCPKIGNNVDIGYGAIIIGDIEIADNVKIGAGSVVTKSICTPGVTVVGVPGRIIEN